MEGESREDPKPPSKTIISAEENLNWEARRQMLATSLFIVCASFFGVLTLVIMWVVVCTTATAWWHFGKVLSLTILALSCLFTMSRITAFPPKNDDSLTIAQAVQALAGALLDFVKSNKKGSG